jgi:hypothetical protein
MLGRLMDPDIRRQPAEHSPGQPYRERSQL